jgi:TPR repeat protein
MGLTRPELIFLAGILIFGGGCRERSASSESSHSPPLADAEPSEAAPELPSPTPTTQTAEPPLQPIPPLVAKHKAEDQATLGMKYAKGDGVPVDLKEAFRLFTHSAEAGSQSGQYYLGAAYSHGKGVAKDDKTAFKWCLESAKQGHVKAQVFVGEMYAKGQGVQRNATEAFAWFKRAADQNDSEAQYQVGMAYYFAQGVEQDYAQGGEWLRKAAKNGYLVAQANLGNFLTNGYGIQEDLVEGIMWIRKAAEQNHAYAQSNIVLLYQQGRGVPKDRTEAIKWFRKASEQNIEHAQIALAGLLSISSSKLELEESAKWYRVAAENGNAEAQFCLGVAFGFGKGVAMDSAAASGWYRKAANQGHAPAMNNLAALHVAGNGVVKDETEAAILFTEAAIRGFTISQYMLGISYRVGRGVPVDDVEAYKWFLIAGGNGFQDAKNEIANVEKFLTPDQRAEGQRLARDFQPKQSGSIQPWDQDPKVSDAPSSSQPKQSGSGFFITPNGYFITNYHVTKDAKDIRLVTKAGAIQAKLISADPANDLVLLKADGSFTPLPVTPSRNVRLGTTVATVGFPNISLQGQSPKLAKGEIASLAGVQDDARWFQISVPVQPGNSGGPLVDDLGNVVGVIVAKLSQKTALATTGTLAENVNYAIKSSFLLSFLEATPDVASGLVEAATERREFEEVVTETEKGSALVLVY